MKKIKILIAAFAISISFGNVSAQETVKVMFYNLLNFPLENNVPNRDLHLDVILSDYQPDLFLVCELNNASGANTILSVLQNINSDYSMATFELNTSDDNIGNQNDLQNLIFYDSTKFILESQNIVTTIFRDFNHYQLKLNTANQATNPIILDIIVCHLKASNGTQNAALRFQMTEDLTTYLDTLPTDSNIIFGGDFNFYTSSEDGFEEIINLDNTNNITFVDPANRIGSWHNNTNYLDVFTQSTRTQTGLGGATGGFDDRFDFIMASENMLTNTDIFYVADSYQVYGNNNNNNCWNREINSTDCAGADFSSTLRNALYNFSDHLPVTIQLQTNESLSTNEFALNDANFIGSNVVKNTLNLKINPLASNESLIVMYNTLGQIVKTVKTTHSNTLSIDVSTFANGIYYLQVPELSSKPLKFIISN